MKIKQRIFRSVLIWATLSLCLTGCGGAKVLKEPEPLVATQAVASAADQRLSVTLDWVIVRDGPGTWAKNADWDEYLISMHNLGDAPLEITGITVVDSLGTPVRPGTDRKQLVKAAKQAKRRYKGEALPIKAGAGAGMLLTAGAVAGATTAAALSGGILVTGGTAVAATGGLILAPVFATGGIMRGVNNSRVNDQIVSRQTLLPLVLQARQEQDLNVFFPLTPSPQQVEISYADPQGEYTLTVDTQYALNGLHIAESHD